jgi:hypothetical protein
MKTRSNRLSGVWLAAILLSGLGTVCARAESDDYSPNALRRHRLELLVRAGQDGLKPLAPAVLHFATESEHCRITYGSKACGLPLDSLQGGEVEQVFDYYIKQPTAAAVAQQQPFVHREDWDWSPDSRPSNQPGDKRR